MTFKQTLLGSTVSLPKPKRPMSAAVPELPRVLAWNDDNAQVGELPTIGVGKRGIVLCPPVIVEGNSFQSRAFDRQHLTSALLFWDAIVYPTNNVIRIGSEEINALVQLGCAHEARIVAKVSLDISLSILPSDPGFVFKHLEKSSPSRWGLSRAQDAIAPRSDELQTHSGALIGLMNCIPVPSREVAFEDILEFKAHRSDELLALRSHFDDFASAIASAGDVQGEFIAKIDLIDRSLADQLRVTKERFGIADLITINAGFSVTDAFRAAAVVVTPLLSAGVGLLPSFASAGVAGLAAGVSIDANAASLKTGGQAKPFQYVVNAHKELG